VRWNAKQGDAGCKRDRERRRWDHAAEGEQANDHPEIKRHGHDLLGAQLIVMRGHEEVPEEVRDQDQREHATDGRVGTGRAGGADWLIGH